MAQDKRVSILIAAKDQATGVLSSVNRAIGGLARSLVSLPALIAGAAGGFAAGSFLKGSLEAINAQIKAEQKLGAVLKATGGAAGFSAEQLAAHAAAMQKVTVFGDEVILNAQAILATFTKINGDQFSAATEAAMNLSTVMGVDLDGAVKQVGKALNDPVQGLSALSRIGVQFTEQQKQQIKALSESGRAMEAQQIILGELEKKFGGAARAMAQGPAGAMKQAANAFGDFKELIGAQLLPVLGAAAQRTTAFFEANGKAIADFFGRVVEVAMGLGRAVSAAVSIVAPLVVGAFTAVRDTAVPILAAGLRMAMDAFRAVNDYVTPIVISLYGTISEVLRSIASAFSDGFNFILDLLVPVKESLGGLGDLMAAVKETIVHHLLVLQYGFRNWQDVATLAGLTVIESVVTVAGQIGHFFGTVIPATLDWFAGNWRDIFTDLFNFTYRVLANLGENIIKVFTNLPGLITGSVDWSDVWTPLTEGFRSAVKELPQIAERQKSDLEKSLELDISRLQGSLAGGFQAFAAERAAQIDAVVKARDDARQQIAAAFSAGAGGLKLEIPKLPGALTPVAAPSGDGGGFAASSPRKGVEGQSLSSRFLGLAERFKSGRDAAGPEVKTAENTAKLVKAQERQAQLLERLVNKQDRGGVNVRDVRLA